MADMITLTEAPNFIAGDIITITGMWRNPERRWWQFWKPRYVPRDEIFECISVKSNTIHIDEFLSLTPDICTTSTTQMERTK